MNTMRQVLRSLVALALVVSVPAAAWATCAERGAGSAGRPTCQMSERGGGCCCRAAHGTGELPDCCKVKTHTTQPTILMAPPATPDLRAAATADAGDVVDRIAAPGVLKLLLHAEYFPLKFPHGPTYLRISVLLI